MTIQEINTTIEEGKALKDVSVAYTEIASLKLKKIRQEVFKSRAFFGEVLNIYALVRKVASKKSIPESQSIRKRAILILTSNNRFYGTMDKNVVNLFLSHKAQIPDPQVDVIVVGQGGAQNLKALGFEDFSTIVMRQDLPEPEELVSLTTRLKKYAQVLVYFAQFQTVVKQTPVVVDITQLKTIAISRELKDLDKKNRSSFIFEPEAAKILEFFDSQIKQVLIGETFLEVELARTGSRLILMDQAQHNADEYLDKQHKLFIQAKRSLDNARILELIASMIQKEKL